jgi:hypothetical protein
LATRLLAVVRSRPGRLTIGRRLNNLPHQSARQRYGHDTLGFRGFSKRIELASTFMSRTQGIPAKPKAFHIIKAAKAV